MAEYRLKLISSAKFAAEITLELHEKSDSPISLEHDICKDRYVFADHLYSAELLGDNTDSIDEITFLVNGFPVSQTFKDGVITFHDPRFHNSRIFLDNFGYVQLEIVISSDGITNSLCTKYIAVMVRKGLVSESVQRMAAFVYQNHEPFLYENRMSSRSARGLKENAPQILDSKIKSLYRVIEAYETNYRFFKTNSKFKVRLEGEYVNFEKAQYFDHKTIESIVRSPSHLIPSSGDGLQIHNSTFLPAKVFSKTSKIDFDIYENQVIVSFLRALHLEVETLIREIDNRISSIPAKDEVINGYFASACFIYDATKRQLDNIRTKLNQACDKLIELYNLYQGLLKVTITPILQPPKPSAILLSIHHYRAVYDSIVEWFRFGVYDFAKEDFMLPFLQMHKLYEYYVLTKLCVHMEIIGYTLVHRDKYSYQYQSSQNAIQNFNTFYFEKGSKRVTLYYEPIVNGKKNIGDNGLNLFRNTSISYPKELDIDKLLDGKRATSGNNKHYCPDYIIKIQNADHDDYIVLDAKFSTVYITQGVYLPNLAYKYLFSMSTIRPEDSIIGLCLINGKSLEETDVSHDVYDFARDVRTIKPFATVLTLTENSTDNTKTHQELLSEILL